MKVTMVDLLPVAQTMTHGLTLVSPDPFIAHCPVSARWEQE
jgi:PIN domain nuclease of toxin-antitoxin system